MMHRHYFHRTWLLLGVLILLLVGLGVGGCQENPDQLLERYKTHIDTTAQNRIKILTPKLDSICKNAEQEQMKGMVDSLIATRRRTIEKMLGQ